MRILILGGACVLALGCAPAPNNSAAAGCDARAAATWQAGAVALSVEAVSSGPDCANAVAMLVVRDGGGAPLFADTYLAAHVMTLAGADTQAAMTAALGEWLDAGAVKAGAAEALPEWPANAEAPVAGEFPFYPSEGIDQAAYNAARAADAPLYCYVQGMESLRCLGFDGATITDVGAQLFPG